MCGFVWVVGMWDVVMRKRVLSTYAPLAFALCLSMFVLLLLASRLMLISLPFVWQRLPEP